MPNTYLLYVGTIDHPGKNLFALLSAFIRLKQEKKIDKNLVIVGRPGHNYRYIEQIILRCEFKEDIKVLGYVDDEHLPFYAGASLFCFLSLYEGFGLPVLEAMACGCPVIAASRSSIPEVAGDAAMLLDPTNLEEVANAINVIVNSPDLRRDLITKGLLRAKRFDWALTAAQYYEVLVHSVIS